MNRIERLERLGRSEGIIGSLSRQRDVYTVPKELVSTNHSAWICERRNCFSSYRSDSRRLEFLGDLKMLTLNCSSRDASSNISLADPVTGGHSTYHLDHYESLVRT